ncbi:hypothetical protein, partial [Klebsiella pneumoniae]|uniref:hypothetical protein n=1 Tax=Klebsiella pneumoniae TaxID=573 RepID=UPI001F1A25E7
QVEAFFAAHPQLTERARALIPIIQPSGIVPWEQLRLPNEVDGTRAPLSLFGGVLEHVGQIRPVAAVGENDELAADMPQHPSR